MLQPLNARCEQHAGFGSLTSLIWLTLGAFAIGRTAPLFRRGNQGPHLAPFLQRSGQQP